MKKHLTLLVLLIALTSSMSYGQESQGDKYSDQFINDCIIEVFGNKSDNLVFNNQERYKLINSFFNRAFINLRQDIPLDKNFPNLFDQPLNNKYAKQMTKDVNYNVGSQLNIFKYDIPMNPKKPTRYRIGSTQYFLTIYPIK